MQSECFIRSDRKLSLIFCTIWIVEQSFKLFRAKVRNIFFSQIEKEKFEENIVESWLMMDLCIWVILA